ncbi:MAG: hypothetical protein O2955_21685 [Planctomycetota bacterium]|nr:hypothetical protein [Planctomycetota bacterium]MDA1215119.1 hypothetical protein [Planctomycetota bacterium]
MWSQTVRVRQTVYQPASVVVRTVILSSLLTSVYAAYSTWITPHFMQKQKRTHAVSAPTELPSFLADNVEWAKKYLADHPWTCEPGYQFRTPEAFVYTKSWKHLENGDVQFEPFALIWRRQGKNGEEEPIRVVSERARVTFARSFNMSDPDPGPVVKGSLDGHVVILGGNGLKIVGDNFHFSANSKSIFSDYAVEMQQGRNRGRADRMWIDLITNNVNENDDQPVIAGFRAIKFLKDVQLDIVANADNTDDGTPIHIECEESLVYDVPSSVARFEGTVIAQREAENEKIDELHCDELRFFFSKPASQSQADTLPTEPTEVTNDLPIVTGIESGLTLDRIQADGEEVWIYSDVNEMSSKMKQLVYRLVDRVISMTDPGNVEVRVGHPASTLKCPHIDLHHDEAGTIVSALCDGSGDLKYLNPETKQTELKSSWKKRLRLFPDRLSGLRVLELSGEAVVTQPHRKMGIRAETIRAWIHGDFKSDVLASTEAGSKSDAVPAGESDAVADELRIERVLALKDVVIASPQLQGITQRMEALFDHSSNVETPETSLGMSPRRDRLSKSRRDLQLTSQSGRARVTDSPSAKKHDDFGSLPLNLRAERTRVHLRPGDDDQAYAVSQIFTSGNVLLTQNSDDGKSRDLEMTGTTVSVVNSGAGDEVLHVEGQPAQIRRQQMVLEGGNITVDRGQNRSIVDGPGRLLLPVKNGLDGKRSPRPGRLEVRWQEQMDFDGQLARFFGQVQAHQQHDIMRCQEMQVSLNSQVSFTDRRPDDADEPSVKNVRCIDGVEVESSEYDGSQLLSIRRARFWDFSLDQETGDTKAMGPGYITIWQREASKQPSFSPSAIVLANRATTSDNAEWEYTRIDFFGKSDGNIHRKTTKFQDRVVIVYGPVERPLETIDPDHLGVSGGWMRCQELQVAHLQNADDERPHIELLAKGNAELDGRTTLSKDAATFHGLADQISFDESKDLYTLRSFGQQNATLYRQTQLGGEPNTAFAQTIRFIPELNQLEFDKTTSLDGVE